MGTIWHSLLWKEWHEHKWKLLALVVILLAVPLCSIHEGPGMLFSAITVAILVYAFLSAMFIGMGTAAGENARNTMPFLQALPVPIWKAAAAKLLWASITIVVPLLVVIGLAFAWYHVGGRLGYDFQRDLNLELQGEGGIEGWYAPRLAGGVLAALSLLVWVVASGGNRQDEVRAGAIAVLVIVCYYFLIMFVGKWENQKAERAPWFEITAATAPAGPAIVGGLHSVYERSGRHLITPSWALILAASASHAGLATWFLLRFGRTPGISRESRRAAIDTGGQAMWFAPPRRSRLTALLWKQMRETGPFVVLGIAAIVGSTTLIYPWEGAGPQPRGEYGSILQGMCGSLGFFIMIVAGISVLLDDLKPGLHTFWRSRPINADLWFWVKFLTGLAITTISLGIPTLLGQWFIIRDRGGSFCDTHQEGVPMIFLTSLVSIYCFAVVAMALVRRPIYAAVFAIGMILAVAVILEYFMTISFEFGFDAASIFALVLSTIATLIAWLAVRYDIGYKG